MDKAKAQPKTKTRARTKVKAKKAEKAPVTANEPEADPRIERHIEKALVAEPPSGLEFALQYRIIQQLFRPRVFGAENIPEKPCLFVGNHSLLALDGMVLTPVVLKQLGRFLRPMGDRFTFSLPGSEDFFLKRGAVLGHPRVCSALMEAGEDLLVFPGGAHEAVKPKRDLYTLQWKQRYGFVRLAAEHGYTIMPFGMVGPDDFYDHLMEGEDLPDSALGQVLRRLGILSENTRPDLMPPIPVGALGSWFPKLQRCYIGFGKPLDLSKFKGQALSPAKLRSLRSKVAKEIELQLEAMLAERESGREQDGPLRRLLTL